MIKSWSFNGVSLYWYNEPPAPLDWTQHVSADELQRAATMASPTRAHTFLSARTYLRQQLAVLTNTPPIAVPITINANGKPHTPGGAFSLSHSHGTVLIAISTTAEAVGVDIQHCDSAVDITGIATRFFDTAEAADVATAPTHQQRALAFEIWCKKEAVFKLGTTPVALTAAPLENNFTYAVCHT